MTYDRLKQSDYRRPRPFARKFAPAPSILGRFTAIAGPLLLGLTLAIPACAEPSKGLPAFATVKAGWASSETKLLDRHGRLVQEIRVDPNLRRTDWTPLDAVSPAFIAALLRAEDKRFFEHAGVDWLAAGKAALANWLAEKPRGASTLSMQLAALLDTQYRPRAGRRGLAEKWAQMRAARELERTWRKADILEAYLNLAAFRGELAGIDAAARGLFDKRPAGLSEAESLLLATLVRAPNAKPAEVARHACALATDLPGGPDCGALRKRALNALGGGHAILPAANWAPHLARRLQTDATATAFLASPPPRAEAAGRGRIATTLDADLQRFATTTLKAQLARLAARNVQDAAALVVDNAGGEVLAYVSLSGAASASPHSDGVRAPRQAGSTLKPFLYGQALEQRLLTAASPLDDTPMAIADAGGVYAPRNYDLGHRGLVSLRPALAASLNIPAVRVLQLVGLEPFAAALNRFGFAGLTEAADFHGYALALGGLDVRLEELVNAYRALANGGLLAPLRFTPADPAASPRRVLGRESAFLIADILSDRQARALTFGLENPLATRFWTAVKTGTSKDMRDNWCIGFSSRYTVGVWVGNFSGASMHDVSGISGAAPAWAAIMARLHADEPSSPPPPPAGLVRRNVQPPGEIARPEWFLAGSEPAGAAWAAATPPALILQPNAGAILAMDPDIPAERQRLGFRASHLPEGAIWTMDGDRHESDEWPLARGRHRLQLVAPEGGVLDGVVFEVR